MIKVLINADDFGINNNVNKAIEKAIQHGHISSTSIIANGPCFLDTNKIVHKYPCISFGVHLNLIEFRPLTNRDVFSKYDIVDNEGLFIEGTVAARESFPQDLQQAIYEEWDAQITMIEEQGITPTHIDSHQHTHTILELQDILIKVAKKHNIEKIRRKSVPSIPFILLSRLKVMTKVVYKDKKVKKKDLSWIERKFNIFKVIYKSRRWNARMSKSFILTDGFYSFAELYDSLPILRPYKKHVIELMCHPGLDVCQNETSLLFSDSLKNKMQYELISFKQI